MEWHALQANILEPSAEQCNRIFLEQPVLSLIDMEVLKRTKYRGWKAKVLDIVYTASHGHRGLQPALDKVCAEACAAALDGYQLIVLTDRNAGPDYVPVR